MKETLIYGLHAVQSCLETSPERIQTLYLLKGRRDARMQALMQLADDQHCAVKAVDKNTLTDMAKTSQHQGVVAVCTGQIKQYQEKDILKIVEAAESPAFLLILDNVQDPHNLGACLRSADAAKVDCVITPKANSVGLTPTVCKVACGAAETTPFIQVSNLARTMRSLQEAGVWLHGLAGEAEQSVYSVDLTGPIALVLGAEGKGLRRLTREHCDVLMKIPMQGSVSSLNVSVATGVSLFEVVRQRGKKISSS